MKARGGAPSANRLSRDTFAKSTVMPWHLWICERAEMKGEADTRAWEMVYCDAQRTRRSVQPARRR